MSYMNTSADARKVRTGKDGCVLNANGKVLASVESFKASSSFSSQSYKPLGDFQEHAVPDSYKVTLVMSYVLIEDDQFIKDIFAMMKDGIVPNWTFQGKLQGLNNSANVLQNELVTYRSCVPDGNIDIQNLAVGDIVKREINMTVNEPPSLDEVIQY